MCGRYSLTDPERARTALSPLLDVDDLPEAAIPRYNIAPTQEAVIVRNLDRRVLEMSRWGLVPSWAVDLSIGSRMINARSESVADKPAFRDSLRARRCLVPADGFFEWRAAGKRKEPHFIHRAERQVFTLAGLWDIWRSPEGLQVMTYAVLTCRPNAVVAELHDRMPVIIEPADWDRWLATERMPPEALDDLFQPSEADDWVAEQVGEYVNKAGNEGPECVDSRPRQTSLF